MMRAIAITALLGASACSTAHMSYIDPDITDRSGILATEITNVALRRSGKVRPAINIVSPVQDEHPIAPTIPASMAGAGFKMDENAAPLRYYISKLYGGVLLRVEYLGEWTAQFFRVRAGDVQTAGPLTINKRSQS